MTAIDLALADQKVAVMPAPTASFVFRSFLLQLAQRAEQFAKGVRRFVAQFFLAGIAGELAQMLAIGVRKFLQYLCQGFVALRDQVIAKRFEAMQAGVLAA